MLNFREIDNIYIYSSGEAQVTYAAINRNEVYAIKFFFEASLRKMFRMESLS